MDSDAALKKNLQLDKFVSLQPELKKSNVLFIACFVDSFKDGKPI